MYKKISWNLDVLFLRYASRQTHSQTDRHLDSNYVQFCRSKSWVQSSKSQTKNAAKYSNIITTNLQRYDKFTTSCATNLKQIEVIVWVKVIGATSSEGFPGWERFKGHGLDVGLPVYNSTTVGGGKFKGGISNTKHVYVKCQRCFSPFVETASQWSYKMAEVKRLVTSVLLAANKEESIKTVVVTVA